MLSWKQQKYFSLCCFLGYLCIVYVSIAKCCNLLMTFIMWLRLIEVFQHWIYDYCISSTMISMLGYFIRLLIFYPTVISALVRKEIQDETDRITGKTKQISPVPIHLSIYSPIGTSWNPNLQIALTLYACSSSYHCMMLTLCTI